VPAELRYQATFQPGDKSWHPCDARESSYSAVFEDDGDTGYFYAYHRDNEPHILDAVHIYNVANIADRDKTSTVQIGWSSDGSMAALVINNFVHALIDFSAKRSCCRTGFPPHSGTFSADHTWDEAMLDDFKSR
jgi:hypothetical protein